MKQQACMLKSVSKKNMLVELCAGNYATHYDLVNGPDGLFNGSSILPNFQMIIWILFNKFKIEHLIRIKNNHLYTQEIHPTLTPIEPIFKEIKIGSNSNHIIIRTQFPIQLVVDRTIHHVHGLSLDYLAFDPTGVYRHDLLYTALSRIKNLSLLQPLQMKNLHVDPNVSIDMNRLRTTTHWVPNVPILAKFRDSHVVICSLNTRSLSLYKDDIYSYYNETHFDPKTSYITSFIDMLKHSFSSVYDCNGTMIVYDNHTKLFFHETHFTLGAKFIVASFNTNTRKSIHIIALYRPSTLPVTTFLNHLRHFLNKIPISCPTTILGDFNINMLNQNSYDVKGFQHFMKFYNMYLQFQENTTIYDSHNDHLWTNAPSLQCIFGTFEAYWTDHRLIYFSLKIPNYVLQYCHVN